MTNILSFEALLNNTYFFSQDAKKDFFVYISLKGIKAEKTTNRQPLNVSLVIDRSGSMSGDKLDYTKKAIDFVIDNVESSDMISIVQYDDKVDVVSETDFVNDKSNLHKKVSQIKAGGSTNLSGGMLEGYNQVKNGRKGSLMNQLIDIIKTTQKESFVNRVLLLSDGLANVGVTDLAQLQMMAQKKFREDQIGLSTFGVGADFNEELMTNLAEYGGANYYFIEKPDSIPQIFAKELSGLLAVIAQNTQISVKFASQYAKCTKVYGYPATITDDKVTINFNDIFSEEQKAVLLHFEVLKPFDGVLPLEVSLSYDDVIKKMDKITETKTLSVVATQDENLFKTGINTKVLEQVVLFVSNEMFENVLKEMDKRNFELAKQQLTQIKLYLDTNFQYFVPSEELKKQYKIITDYLSQIDEMQTMNQNEYMIMQKSSKMSNYDFRKKKQ
jgi:Ca-activated chloride channel family protein